MSARQNQVAAYLNNVNRRRYRLAISDATPELAAELFGAGEAGAWWDPSDLSTMFQDSAGLVPVTADGDPVGCIKDLSGNRNHMVQSTAGSRPIYRTAAGLHWVESSGVGQWLRATFAISQPWERISGIRQIAWLVNDNVFGGVIANTGMLQQISASPTMRLFGTSGACNNAGAAVGTNVVATEKHDGASSRLAFNNGAYVNGNLGAATLPGGVTLFASFNAAIVCNAAFYGGIMRGGLMADAKVAELRTYFGARAGLVL